MKSDAEIRDDVINELQWDPQITKPLLLDQPAHTP